MDGWMNYLAYFLPLIVSPSILQHTSNGVLQAVSSSVSAMLDAVAVTGCMVKSQQIDEAELTMEERREELLRQYQTRPLVFLERYQVRLDSVCTQH